MLKSNLYTRFVYKKIFKIEYFQIKCLNQTCIQDLYTRYPIVARALGLGRVRARAKESCIQIQDTLSAIVTRRAWHFGFVQLLGRMRRASKG